MISSNLLQSLHNSISANAASFAFSINNQKYTYGQLASRVAFIQSELLLKNAGIDSAGIIANQDFDTYAAIVACLLSGITYIPIEPEHPDERNKYIVEISELQMILCSNRQELSKTFSNKNQDIIMMIPPGNSGIEDIRVRITDNPAYVLFTSGTTGVPKGVPVSTGNLEAFAENIDRMELGIDTNSRFLQFIDLTFDLSVFCYLIPLLHGSTIFCLPKSPLKYTQSIQLIETNEITHILTVPSFVQYLKPYFDEISLPSVRHWLFCGEALKSELVRGWQPCIPNGIMYNVYGPTEATIFCSEYKCNIDQLKDQNGIVSIGKAFNRTALELFNDGKTVTEPEVAGELCIGGDQLTKGYLKDPTKNKISFFEYGGTNFYHSGDVCRRDADGDLFYSGRNDSQVKVHGGYRIELGEIEYHISSLPHVINCAALAVDDIAGISVIYVFIQSKNKNEDSLFQKIKQLLPGYMLPKRLIFIDEIPINLNGKTDRIALAKLL